MRVLAALWRAYWSSVQGRCMIHGVPMEERPREGFGGPFGGDYALVCPICEGEKGKTGIEPV